MLLACHNLEPESFNVIFSSYALHHFTVEEKTHFIKKCQTSLKQNGLFILIDGVMTKGQSREEWLQVMETETLEAGQEWSAQAHAIEHMRSSDFPEALEFFSELAKKQDWRHIRDRDFSGIIFSLCMLQPS